MDANTTVYLIRDRQGKVIVLTTRAEAEEFALPDSPQPGVEELPFGWVVEHYPKALVRIFYQYYYAHELVEPA